MPWDEQRQQARYEVVWRGADEWSIHAAIEVRAKRTGLTVASYLKLLAQAVINQAQGDTLLESLLERDAGLQQQVALLEARVALLERHVQGTVDEAPERPLEVDALDAYLGGMGR